jgi:hypothetical protein
MVDRHIARPTYKINMDPTTTTIRMIVSPVSRLAGHNDMKPKPNRTIARNTAAEMTDDGSFDAAVFSNDMNELEILQTAPVSTALLTFRTGATRRA